MCHDMSNMMKPQANMLLLGIRSTSPSQDLCITVLSKIQDITLVSGQVLRHSVGITFYSLSMNIMIIRGFGKVESMIGIVIWPSVRLSKSAVKEDGTVSFEPGTAPNGRRNAYLGTCIRQQAHSTTLDKGTELWGTSQKVVWEKASAANLFSRGYCTVILVCFFPSLIMQVIGVLWSRSRQPRCGSEKTALHVRPSKIPSESAQSKK
jgi:Na+-transporting methylmalonyl-CoA/oxaloacetate decarboxylase gamma subunit